MNNNDFENNTNNKTEDNSEQKQFLYFENIDQSENNKTEIPKNNSSVYSITCLVFGILGIAFCVISYIFSFIFAAASIVTFVIDKKLNENLNGLSIAGLVCGIAAVVTGVISIFVIYFVLLPAAEAQSTSSTLAILLQYVK